VLVAFVAPFIAGNAFALTVPFSLTDFKLSTVTTSGVSLNASPSSAPALPADATFTDPADAVLALPPTPSNTYLASQEGKFLRFNFNLPANFSELGMTFEALVNDHFALYVNDTVVAIQATTSTLNFAAPLPGFAMDAGGLATDTSGKLEYLLANGIQPLFKPGPNELTLFGADTLLFGGISAIDGTVSLVPEAETYAMMLAGLGLVVVATRGRTSSRLRSGHA
jgi:hypothetical protein